MIKILLPVDGSERALDAVHHALRLTRDGLQADFVLANVQPPSTLYEVVTAPDAQTRSEVNRAAGQHALQAAAALLDAAGARYETEVVTADPAHGVLDIAERYAVDAIVIGAGGVGGLRDALLGSVANTVLHDAAVPVTVVPLVPPPPALDEDAAADD